MTLSKNLIALLLAGAFFVAWIGILYAGADHPPPIGFLWLVLIVLIAAGLVYLRVPTYIAWAADGTRLRLLRVLLEGMAVGLLFAFVSLLFPGNGEPSVPSPDWGDRAIWLAVLAVIGGLNALFVYVGGAVLNRLAGSAY